MIHAVLVGLLMFWAAKTIIGWVEEIKEYKDEQEDSKH